MAERDAQRQKLWDDFIAARGDSCPLLDSLPELSPEFLAAHGAFPD